MYAIKCLGCTINKTDFTAGNHRSGESTRYTGEDGKNAEWKKKDCEFNLNEGRRIITHTLIPVISGRTPQFKLDKIVSEMYSIDYVYYKGLKFIHMQCVVLAS